MSSDARLQVAGREYDIVAVRSTVDMPAVLPERAPVCLDIETNGVPVYSSDFEVRTIQISSPAWDDLAYVVPAQIEYYPYLHAILKASPAIIGHNLMYEWAALARVDLTESPWCYWDKSIDTQLLTAVVSHPRGPSGDARLGLKDNVRALVDPEYDLDKQLKDFMNEGWHEVTGQYKTGPRKGQGKTKRHKYTWATVPMDSPAFLRYAAGDVIVPPLLFDALNQAAYSRASEHYKIARDLTRLMQRRIARGLEVDGEHLEMEEQRNRNRYDAIAPQLEAAGLDPTKGLTGDNRDVLLGVIRRAGITPPKSAKTGEPSLSRDGIVLAADGAANLPPLLSLWYEKEQIGKFQTAYLDLFREGLENDGVVHPDVRVMQAATGRTSVARPPLQQLPRVGETRSCLRARSGYVLVGADLSQIEPRIAGALSQDRALLDVIASGQKMHVIVATNMFGTDYSEDQYNIAKTAGLAWLYGGGVKTIAEQTGESRAVSTRLKETLEYAFTGVVAYKDHLKYQDRVVTQFGREIQLDPTRPWSKMNYEIQGSAYDLFTAGTLRAAEVLGDDAIWLTVHDEVLAEVPEEDAEPAAHALGEALSTEFMGVPCPAVGQVVGRNWRKT